jgi:hypothetical protein
MLNRERMLLGKYYDVDDENKIVTMSYCFDEASLVVDNSLDNKEYLIKDEIMEKIISGMKSVPLMYKININVRINDFQNYSKEKVVEAFEDGIEMNHYSLERENKRKWIKTLVLVIIGIVILFFNTIAKSESWFGTKTTSSGIASEVFDIAAWVFIWEAVTIMFLTPTELPFNSNRIKIRVKNINFLDKNKNIIGNIRFDLKDLKWDSISKLDSISKKLFLIGGAAFLGIATCDLISNIRDLIVFIKEPVPEILPFIISTTAISFVIDALEFIAGIGTLSIYNGHGPLKRTAGIIGIVLTILFMAIFTLVIISGASSLLTSIGWSFVSYLLYVIGYIVQFIINKRRKRLEKIKQK